MACLTSWNELVFGSAIQLKTFYANIRNFIDWSICTRLQIYNSCVRKVLGSTEIPSEW